MVEILNQYERDGVCVTEYTKDGTTVSHIVKVPMQTEPIEPVDPQPTSEEVTEATLLETRYQTLLIEMLAGF